MKHFIIDTNVILYDPHCFFEFDDNHVIVLFDVLEELDTFKGASGDLGHNAREAIRILDSLRTQGLLKDGVPINGGIGLLSVTEFTEGESVDNRILAMGRELISNGKDAIVVTKDINMRVKGDAVGVPAVDYEKGKVDDHGYTGFDKLKLTANQERDMRDVTKHATEFVPTSGMFPNQYFRFVNEADQNLPFLGRYVIIDDSPILKCVQNKPKAMSIEPRNLEQTYLLDALLDDDISVVTAQGLAGSGKTLIAIAAAYQKVLKERVYDNIVITRPVVPVGDDMGFLPGDAMEKMAPWMKPIYDNINVICSGQQRSKKTKDALQNGDKIEVAPLAYIRGRSISNAFVIIDEAQNLSPSEVKTIVTRIGEVSKIVFTGDVSQIDKITLDKHSSGFSYLIDRFKGQDVFAHIELTRSERSMLAELGAELL